MHINKKKFFTLLEIIIVIGLLSVVGSVVGFKVQKNLKIHQFHHGFEKIESYIEYSRKMAMTHQSDVYLVLSQKKENIYIEMGTDGNSGFFKGQKAQKDKVKGLTFSFSRKKSVTVLFSSTGCVLPEGTLTVSDGERVKEIEIKGFRNTALLPPDLPQDKKAVR